MGPEVCDCLRDLILHKTSFRLQLVSGANRNQSMLYFKKLLLACELIFLPVLKETQTLSSFPSPSVSLDTLQQNLQPAGTCPLRLFLLSDFRKKPKTDSNWTLRSYAHPLANARSIGWNLLIRGCGLLNPRAIAPIPLLKLVALSRGTPVKTNKQKMKQQQLKKRNFAHSR